MSGPLRCHSSTFGAPRWKSTKILPIVAAADLRRGRQITSYETKQGQVMQRTAIRVVAAVSLSFSTPAFADEQDWDTASTVARDGLVVAALGIPAVQGDWTGAKQAALSLGTTQLVTTGLKNTIHAERPDQSNNKSFPSGHTSMSFAAAATIGKRHGWEYGVPAHLVAAFVGLARVEAKKHYVEDVLVGAAIGEAAGWLFTQPANTNVQFFPWGDTDGAGLQVAMRF